MSTFTPDHNGECLHCDEWLDSHSVDGTCPTDPGQAVANQERYWAQRPPPLGGPEPRKTIKGKRIHQWIVTPENPTTVDLGWGTAVFNDDGTVTRTCKGCGAHVTSPYTREGNRVEVPPVPFHHRDNCPMWATIERHTGRS